MRRRLYLAGPLFSLAEKEFNSRLKALLSEYFEVFLPQEDGGLLVEMIREGTPAAAANRRVFDIDVAAIEWCDCILIILDGRAVDEGAAFELGYAYACEKECVALQTDSRRLFANQNNPMIDVAVQSIFTDIKGLLKWAVSAGRLRPTSVARSASAPGSSVALP